MNSTRLDVRGLQYHIQEWGERGNPTLVLLHGWMDCGASFKYVAEHLADRYFVVAPDWRGFGDTEHAPGYWFPDYFADLHEILDYYSPEQPANLVGHSMGGNIVLMYAGIQPHRVSAVISLEALGMAPTDASQAVDKYRTWMNQVLSGEPSKVYPNIESLRRSIRTGNPRLTDAMVDELTTLWARHNPENGTYRLKHDHNHRYTNPVRYQIEDTVAVWREIRAKVGVLMAEDSPMYQQYLKLGRLNEARQLLDVSDDAYALLTDCGHMVHLEQPDATAAFINQFFASVAH